MINKEEVNHPKRYNQYPVEVIDMMISIWGKEAAVNYSDPKGIEVLCISDKVVKFKNIYNRRL